MKIYEGFIEIREYPEEFEEILFLSTLNKPLAEELQYLANKEVSIKYWICDKQITLDDAIESFVHKLYGTTKIEFEMHYSDYTGFLWTDEELMVGGHDLLTELKSYKGKYLILQVEI